MRFLSLMKTLAATLVLAFPAGAQTLNELFRDALALEEPLQVEAALMEARAASDAAGETAAYWSNARY